MKKLFSLFIVMILMFPIVCNAEGFIIHSGTQFGDTIEEVKEKETLDVLYETPSGIIFRGEVAGIEDVWLYYHFDENGKLYDVFYNMIQTESHDLVLETHNMLNSLLKEKYGNPLSEDDEIYQLLNGFNISSILKTDESIKKSIGSDYKISITSWTVQDDNQFIKIDLFIEKDSVQSYCGIEYYPYTEEELAIKKQNLLEDL